MRQSDMQKAEKALFKTAPFYYSLFRSLKIIQCSTYRSNHKCGEGAVFTLYCLFHSLNHIVWKTYGLVRRWGCGRNFETTHALHLVLQMYCIKFMPRAVQSMHCICNASMLLSAWVMKMAEIYVECFNKITGTNENIKKYVISKDLDLCEECGELKHVVIRIKRWYLLAGFARNILSRKR